MFKKEILQKLFIEIDKNFRRKFFVETKKHRQSKYVSKGKF
jgi:hypothetical protein